MNLFLPTSIQSKGEIIYLPSEHNFYQIYGLLCVRVFFFKQDKSVIIFNKLNVNLRYLSFVITSPFSSSALHSLTENCIKQNQNAIYATKILFFFHFYYIKLVSFFLQCIISNGQLLHVNAFYIFKHVRQYNINIVIKNA